jgi:formylglycine-generating enzyme required for sulfatase activity
MSVKNREWPAAQVAGTQPIRTWRWGRAVVLLAMMAGAFGIAYVATRLTNRPPLPPPDMVWIPGGEFVMGANGETKQRNELPAHTVRVDGFFMDETEVTNVQFRAFVEASGYVTTAEKPVDWDEHQ